MMCSSHKQCLRFLVVLYLGQASMATHLRVDSKPPSKLTPHWAYNVLEAFLIKQFGAKNCTYNPNKTYECPPKNNEPGPGQLWAVLFGTMEKYPAPDYLSVGLPNKASAPYKYNITKVTVSNNGANVAPGNRQLTTTVVSGAQLYCDSIPDVIHGNNTLEIYNRGRGWEWLMCTYFDKKCWYRSDTNTNIRVLECSTAAQEKGKLTLKEFNVTSNGQYVYTAITPIAYGHCTDTYQSDCFKLDIELF